MQGGPDDAERGSLGFHLAGSPMNVAAARPIVELIGDPRRAHAISVEPADAYLTKLLGNALWFGQVVAVTEVLLLAARRGLDPGTVRALLADGPGSSVFLGRDAPALLRGETMDAFGLDRVTEELHHLERLATSAGIPHNIIDAVTRAHDEALAHLGPREGELGASTFLQRQAGTQLLGVAESILAPPQFLSADMKGDAMNNKLDPEERREELLRAPKADECDAAPRIKVTRAESGRKRIDITDTAAVRPGKTPGSDD